MIIKIYNKNYIYELYFTNKVAIKLKEKIYKNGTQAHNIRI